MSGSVHTLETPAESAEIERIEAPTWEHFDREYVNRNKPVLMTGIVDRWRAFSDWNTDYLKKVAGDNLVEVSFNEHGDHGRAHQRVREKAGSMSWRKAIKETYPVAGDRKEMRFAELLDLLTGDPPDRRYFLSTYGLGRVSPELKNDLDHDGFVNNGGDHFTTIFLGHDSYTPLHFHGAEEAVLSLIVGRKRVYLYPARQVANLYPYPWYTPMLNLAQVDRRDPDLESFPKFRDATPIVIDMKAGEMLFIPLHWFHAVQCDGYAIGVTKFWQARFRNYTFPTPGLQLYANKYLSPHAIPVAMRRLFRILRGKNK